MKLIIAEKPSLARNIVAGIGTMKRSDGFYEGNGYMAIHAANEGNKKIYLPETVKCTDLTSGDVMLTDVITFECDKFETRMFKLEKAN